jgi:hypothetical protein
MPSQTAEPSGFDFALKGRGFSRAVKAEKS